MDFLADLWLPIILSSVIVFIASSVAWMALPHHKKDLKVLPDEKSFTDELAKLGIPPGTYVWPGCADSQEMKSEDYKARYESGPWGSINIIGKRPNFGRSLGLAFLFYLLVGVFVGYITSQARSAGAESLSVFQVAGATSVLAYCAGAIPHAIFMGTPARFILTSFIDGLVYGLLTAGTFAALWPSAV